MITFIRVGLCRQLTLLQLIQSDLECRFVASFQLGLSISPVSSPCAGLKVVTEFTHLLKDCSAQLGLNPHHTEILPLKQLDYNCMPLHPTHWLNDVFNLFFFFFLFSHLSTYFFCLLLLVVLFCLCFCFFVLFVFCFFLQKTGTIYKIFYDNRYTDSSLYQRLTYSQNLSSIIRIAFYVFEVTALISVVEVCTRSLCQDFSLADFI